MATSMRQTSTIEPGARRYFSIAEAAADLHVAERTIRRAIAAGRLRAHRIGKLIRLDRDDLADYITVADPSAVSR